MSGSGRRELQLGAVASEPMIIKTGAEGVFLGALPNQGVGVALKVRDGATRAADLMIAAVLERLGVIPSGHAVSDVVNAAGTVVGTMQAHVS
jgi:L-asparaginase II